MPLNGKQGKCIDTCNFRAAEMLVGVPPKPAGLLAIVTRRNVVCVAVPNGPAPYFAGCPSARAGDPRCP